MIVVPMNAKIADITHADTAKHFLDLETSLSETRKIIQVMVAPQRMAGTGNLRFFPNEGPTAIYESWFNGATCVIIADGTQRLQYDLTVANDDFDVHCVGYMVEG